MPETRPLLTSKDVCARLNIDRSTLTRWVAAGRIKPVMRLNGPAGAFLFAPADIDQLERDHKRRTARQDTH